ncbi:N1-15 protein, maltese-cross seroactive antigen [Babesia microti strain RI]|uniref:N1-15 protein, maltese-cross seroactive antigen n=1 Tax=Babesia microti (strain RI) TaxID=1133968 RepID=I7IHF0_BABMR|nr:N1-15 protein, maltese-cross seroactive antigen [Babesia microti strain RI]CCF75697.1 N1-15 protein, maltese-cross seroactive antigen [Babesia microti strain RI]|eukprot:XP_012650105.1 N1-15 protein, maltese-cross seroactive antigen [Babesia microti strain RI]
MNAHRHIPSYFVVFACLLNRSIITLAANTRGATGTGDNREGVISSITTSAVTTTSGTTTTTLSSNNGSPTTISPSLDTTQNAAATKIVNLNINEIGFVDQVPEDLSSIYVFSTDGIFTKVTPATGFSIGCVIFGNQLIPHSMDVITRTVSYTNKYPLIVVRIQDKTSNYTSTVYYEQSGLQSNRFVLRDDPGFIIPQNRSSTYTLNDITYKTFDISTANDDEFLKLSLSDGSVLYTNNPDSKFYIGEVKIGEIIIPINITSQYIIVKLSSNGELIELYTTGCFGEHIIKKFKKVGSAYNDISKAFDTVPWIPTHFVMFQKVDFSIPSDLFELNHHNILLPTGVKHSIHINSETGNVDSVVFFLSPLAKRMMTFGNIRFHKINLPPFSLGVIHSITVEKVINSEDFDEIQTPLQVSIIASYGPSGDYNSFVFTPVVTADAHVSYKLETDFKLDVDVITNTSLKLPTSVPGLHYTETIYQGTELSKFNKPQCKLNDLLISKGSELQIIHDGLNNSTIITNKEVNADGTELFFFDLLPPSDGTPTLQSKFFSILKFIPIISTGLNELMLELLENPSSSSASSKYSGLTGQLNRLITVLDGIVDSASSVKNTETAPDNEETSISSLKSLITTIQGNIAITRNKVTKDDVYLLKKSLSGLTTRLIYHSKVDGISFDITESRTNEYNSLDRTTTSMDDIIAMFSNPNMYLVKVAYLQAIEHIFLVSTKYEDIFDYTVDCSKCKATDSGSFSDLLLGNKVKESLSFIEGLISDIKSHSLKAGVTGGISSSSLFDDTFDELKLDQTTIRSLVAPLEEIKNELEAINSQETSDATVTPSTPNTNVNIKTIISKIKKFLMISETISSTALARLSAVLSILGRGNSINALPERLTSIIVDLKSTSVPQEVVLKNGVYKLKDQFKLTHKMIPAFGNVQLHIPEKSAVVQISIVEHENDTKMAVITLDDHFKLTLEKVILSETPTVVGLTHTTQDPLDIISSIFVKMNTTADGIIEGYLDLDLNSKIGNFISAIELTDLTNTVKSATVRPPQLKVLALKFGNQLVEVKETARTFATFDENLNSIEIITFNKDGTMISKFFSREFIGSMTPFEPNAPTYIEHASTDTLPSPWITTHMHNKRLVDFEVPFTVIFDDELINYYIEKLPNGVAYSLYGEELCVPKNSGLLLKEINHIRTTKLREVFKKIYKSSKTSTEITSCAQKTNTNDGTIKSNLQVIMKENDHPFPKPINDGMHRRVESIHFYIDNVLRHDTAFGRITIGNLTLPAFSIGFIHSIFIERVTMGDKSLASVGIITNYGPSGDYELLRYMQLENDKRDFALVQGPEITADYIGSGLTKHKMLTMKGASTSSIGFETNYKELILSNGFMRPTNKIVTLFYTDSENVSLGKLYSIENGKHGVTYSIYGAFPIEESSPESSSPNARGFSFVFSVLNSIYHINKLFTRAYNALDALKVKTSCVDGENKGSALSNPSAEKYLSILSSNVFMPTLSRLGKLFNDVMLRDASFTETAVRMLPRFNAFIAFLNEEKSKAGKNALNEEELMRFISMTSGFIEDLEFVLDELFKHSLRINNEAAKTMLSSLILNFRYINHIRNLINGIYFELNSPTSSTTSGTTQETSGKATREESKEGKSTKPSSPPTPSTQTILKPKAPYLRGHIIQIDCNNSFKNYVNALIKEFRAHIKQTTTSTTTTITIGTNAKDVDELVEKFATIASFDEKFKNVFFDNSFIDENFKTLENIMDESDTVLPSCSETHTTKNSSTDPYTGLSKLIQKINDSIIRPMTLRLFKNSFPELCKLFVKMPDVDSNIFMDLDVDITNTIPSRRVMYSDGRFTIINSLPTFRYTLKPIAPGHDLSLFSQLPISMITVTSSQEQALTSCVNHGNEFTTVSTAGKTTYTTRSELLSLFKLSAETLRDLNGAKFALGDISDSANKSKALEAYNSAITTMKSISAELEKIFDILKSTPKITFESIVSKLTSVNTVDTANADVINAMFDDLSKAISSYLYSFISIKFPEDSKDQQTNEGHDTSALLLEYRAQLASLSRIKFLLVLEDLISSNKYISIISKSESSDNASDSSTQSTSDSSTPQNLTLMGMVNNGKLGDSISLCKELVNILDINKKGSTSIANGKCLYKGTVLDPSSMSEEIRRSVINFLGIILSDIDIGIMTEFSRTMYKTIIANISMIILQEIVEVVNQAYRDDIGRANLNPNIHNYPAFLEPIDIDILYPQVPEHVKLVNGVFKLTGNRKTELKLRPKVGSKYLEVSPHVAVVQVSVPDSNGIINVYEDDYHKITVQQFDMDGNIIMQGKGAISAHPFAQLAFAIVSSVHDEAQTKILQSSSNGDFFKENILAYYEDQIQQNEKMAFKQQRTTNDSYAISAVFAHYTDWFQGENYIH